MATTNVLDVARFILRQSGAMSAMKLQKLVYYSQAWSLVWDDQPLFKDRIEAWANGPVAPRLYEVHRGKFMLNPQDIVGGNSRRLDATQRETVDSVLHYYGKKSAHWLSQLTHMEDPWRNARKGLNDGQRGNHEITLASMVEYYSGL